MRILILNWRDIKNPKGGGAEILTHEMAKRWVKKGHSVTQFSERFPFSEKEENIDGIKIIRQGSADIRSLVIPVHISALVWYLKQKRDSFDVVIDEIHGIPFFTPWYIREKKVALLCEVADKIWNVAFSFPANVLGPLIERNYFRFYKAIPFLTISPSTKKELLEMGIDEKRVTVLPMGLNIPRTLIKRPKEKKPTLIFVGRLTKAKGIEDALRVLDCIRRLDPDIYLWVVGQGSREYTRQIMTRVKDFNLGPRVSFFGYVNQSKKFELMSRAHILIVPSMKEGWGLTVPEAAYVGTPSVAYDVEGLRDVVISGKTGILTKPLPEDMTQQVWRLINDKKLYRGLQKRARQLAETYSWDKTSKVALTVLERA